MFGKQQVLWQGPSHYEAKSGYRVVYRGKRCHYRSTVSHDGQRSYNAR